MTVGSLALGSLVVPHREHDFELSYLLRPGHGETVVYMHGLGSTQRDFLDLLQGGSLPGYTLFSFDFPGSGGSTYLDHVSLGIDDLVELASKIVRALGLGRLTLIGHSMGGLTALRFAARNPDRVERLISVEGNLAPEDCGIFSRRVASLGWEAFVERRLLEEIGRQFAASPFPGARLFAERLPQAVLPHAFFDYCVSIVAHSDAGDLMATFRELPMPRLFIHGAANAHLSYLPSLVEHGIRVSEIPESHHWPHLDNPRAYLEAVREFLATSPSGSEEGGDDVAAQ